ncbi:MAG: dUTP diphosphatase [Chloroflexi bacterium]|nr:dUTP diphosphatase [Chloroflexota bacterium]
MIRGSISLKVKRLRSGARLPQRATQGASGFDLFACIGSPGVTVLGRDPQLIGTGIALEVPPGFDAQIRPRSGLSAQGVGVTLGTIDSDYRGELLVTMYLFGSRSHFEVKDGDRIAQLVVAPLASAQLMDVEDLSPTSRGARGHGSTGV